MSCRTSDDLYDAAEHYLTVASHIDAADIPTRLRYPLSLLADEVERARPGFADRLLHCDELEEVLEA